MPRLLRGWILIHLQRNLGAIGEAAHRVHKTDVLVFLDEAEHVPALVTAEAMEDLFVRIDVELGISLL